MASQLHARIFQTLVAFGCSPQSCGAALATVFAYVRGASAAVIMLWMTARIVFAFVWGSSVRMGGEWLRLHRLRRGEYSLYGSSWAAVRPPRREPLTYLRNRSSSNWNERVVTHIRRRRDRTLTVDALRVQIHPHTETLDRIHRHVMTRFLWSVFPKC